MEWQKGNRREKLYKLILGVGKQNQVMDVDWGKTQRRTDLRVMRFD